MGKINLTIGNDVEVKYPYIKIEHLQGSSATITGTDYYAASNIIRIRDEKDGWWFDRIFQTEFDHKIMFADIVNLNSNPIGSTTQSDITSLLVECITSKYTAK